MALTQRFSHAVILHGEARSMYAKQGLFFYGKKYQYMSCVAKIAVVIRVSTRVPLHNTTFTSGLRGVVAARTFVVVV